MNNNISFSHIYNSLSTGNVYGISRKQTKQFTDEAAVSVSNKAKELRDKCRALARSDYSSGATNNIMTKLAKFIDSYNKLLDESADSTDRTVKRQLKNMKKLITDNQSALKKAGIDIEDDGKLKVNSEVMTKLKTGSKLKSLFGSSNSFITTFQNYSDKIYSSLKFQTVNKEVSVAHKVSLTDTKRTQALEFGALFNDFNTLSSMNYSDNNRNAITNMLTSYVDKYNNYLAGGDDNKSSLNSLININSGQRENLAKAGITINTDDTLALDTNLINNVPVTDLKALFAKNSPYADQTAKALLNLFSDAAGATTEGVSVNVTA